MSRAVARWVQPSFLKDAKLRVRERYWREFESSSVIKQETTSAIIIPDALSWRKYLRLIRMLAAELHDDVGPVWYLLESVAEYMDHRNQSPTIESSRREPATPQERQILQQLILQEHVTAFCDTSVRQTAAEDEWNDEQYVEWTVEERSRHALVRAALLLQKQSDEIPIWILSADDEDGLVLEDGMRRCGMREVLEWLSQQNHLSKERLNFFVELCVICEDEYLERIRPATGNENEKSTAQLYATEEAIQRGLQDGNLVLGRLVVTKENPQEAFVSVAGTKLYVDGQKGHFGRSIHQDIVVLQPLPKKEWGRPVGKRRLVYHSDADDGLQQQHNEDATTPTIPSARVVSVDQPGRRTVVATMVDVPAHDESAVLVIPMDIRIPKIRLRTRNWQRFRNARLKVSIDGWEMGSKYPHGHCVDILGPVGDLEAEVAAVLLENEVQLDPFSLEARACLPPEGEKWVVSEEEARTRKDLRQSRRVFSVDPPGCQDIDDTMHAEALPNGDIEVGVHIADVTHFVKHNSQLDREAQVRGTTFYLVDRRFDMLPSLLSSNLCSLHGNMDRLAVSAIWTLSSNLKEVKSCWYGRTVIHNCAAMTYDQADRILRDLPPDIPSQPRVPPFTAGSPIDSALIPQLKTDLAILTRLARKLKSDREDIGGAVDWSSGDLGGELKFTLDENGNPTEVAAKEDKEIHQTIAEMMIMANSYVATKVWKAFPEAALLRVHRAVEETSFEDLKEALDSQGVALDGSSNMALAETLRSAQQNTKYNAVVNSLFRSLATRAMSEAQYVCTGDAYDGVDLSHYGLGLQKYTHFTSPIRRYADVVVHKQLLAALEQEQRPHRKLKPTNAKQGPLQQLPESNAISILAGEGLEHGDPDELVDSLIAGADLSLDPETNHAVSPSDAWVTETTTLGPYSTAKVSRICHGLNLHNRLAKQSSRDSQELFLSLYFRDHVEVAKAVVVNVRSNGFWVYVPKFDMKGPVYVRAMDGAVQLDPTLVGLPSNAGQEATVGFSASSMIRRFRTGTCTLVETPEERLDVAVPGATKVFSIRALDVVTISLSCDNWDVRARVPSPRLFLLSNDKQVASPTSRPVISSATSTTKPPQKPRCSERDTAYLQSMKTTSLADTLFRFQVQLSPVLRDVPYRSSSATVRQGVNPNYKEIIKGRKIFGDFANPDTRVAVQEAAQQSAADEAARRREQALERSAQRGEYDTSRAIERNVTSRQQRLAAGKRNTRKSKAK